MEVKAIAKSVRISPRKLRLVVDAIRSMKIDDAYRMLEVTHKRAALIVSKTLKSAVANAIVNNNLDAKTLYIASVMVNEAQALKRFRPSTRGRVHHYKKRGSHLTIILKQKIVKTQAVSIKQPEKIEEKGGEK
jgi:large subunit ribosomal protein L22